MWRVLLVDDSPLIRNAMQVALEPCVATVIRRALPAAGIFAITDTALTRALIDRCTGLEPTLDLQIDLTRMPDDAGAVTAVVTAVNRELRAAGAAPALRLGAAIQTAAGDGLGRVVVLRA